MIVWFAISLLLKGISHLQVEFNVPNRITPPNYEINADKTNKTNDLFKHKGIIINAAQWILISLGILIFDLGYPPQ